jgi:hypothetical protein
VTTSDGASIPTKLALPARLAAPEPQTDSVLAAMALERPMRQLWEHMIEETGPLTLADAVSWLREQGADLNDYRGRAEDLFRPFSFFTTERGVLLAHINNSYDGVPVQLHMTRPAHPRPVRLRRYTDPTYIAPLQWGEPSELLSKLRSFDADVHRALGKPQPRGLAMIRRVAQLARLSEKDEFDDFFQCTYTRIAEGALHEDPLDPARPLMLGPKRTQKRATARMI